MERVSQGRLNDLLARLKRRGYRMTPQRLAILRILVSDNSHPSIESIYRRVQDEFPMMSLATVYKTVALLKETGDVFELAAAGEGSHYDGVHPEPHPHLVCLGCGAIIDAEIDGLETILNQVADGANDWTVTAQVQLWGVCPSCRAGSDNPSA
jgi:Fur family peroxide stress response transcriptional regulator